jgi:hypothetical protein
MVSLTLEKLKKLSDNVFIIKLKIMKKRFTITESEKEKIRGLYDLTEQNDNRPVEDPVEGKELIKIMDKMDPINYSDEFEYLDNLFDRHLENMNELDNPFSFDLKSLASSQGGMKGPYDDERDRLVATYTDRLLPIVIQYYENDMEDYDDDEY